MLRNLIQKHWRKLALMVALGAAFALGRGFRPPPEVREVETARYAAVRSERDQLKAEVETLRNRSEVKTVVRVFRPDGTRIEREKTKTDESVHSHAKVDTVAVAKTATSAESNTARVASASRPDWRVGLMVGVSLRLDPLSATPLVGAQVERRILGPFNAGVWVLAGPTTGELAAGGSLSLEF